MSVQLIDAENEILKLRQENDRLRQELEGLQVEFESKSKVLDEKLDYQNNLLSLIKIFQELGNFNVLQDLLDFIIKSVTNILNADRSTLFLMDHDSQELFSNIAEGMGGKEIRFPVGKGIAGAVARTRETILIPDAYNDDRFNPEVDKKTGYRTRNILCMAMCNIENKVIGVIQVLNKNEGDFSEQDVTLLTGFCTHAAVSLESTILYTQMEKLVARRTQDLQEALQSNRDILENTRDGMLIVDKIGVIQPGFSNSCQLILNCENLENENLLHFPFEPITRGDKGVMEQLPSWLEYGWENPEMENWETLSSNVLSLEGKFLEVSFQRIYGLDGIKGFMVIISDITERVQLEREVEEKRKESAETLVTVTSMMQQGKRDFHQFLIALEKQFTEVHKILNESGEHSKNRAAEIFRIYHTLKGMTQTYSIDFMSSSLHEEEDQWVDHLEINSFPENEDLEVRQEALLSLQEATARMKYLFSQIFGDATEQEALTIPTNEYQSFLDDLELLTKAEINYWLSQFQENTFAWLSRSLQRDAQVAGRKSNKSFTWKTNNSLKILPAKHVNTLLPVLSHLIRNSLEHGLESEESRLEYGKAPVGSLIFEYAETESSYSLIFGDDGRGLNKEKILSKAIEKGILNAAQEYSEEEIFGVIFQAGFSTQDEVSTQSGRGVGMDAVKFYVTELQGSIHIQSNAGEGTKFHISLPHQVSIPQSQEKLYERPIRVLIVDDNPVMVKLISSFLADAKCFTTTCCTTISRTLELVETEEFDVVITDLVMPELSGLELISRIHDIQPTCKAVVVTGYPAEEHLQRMMELGVEVHLSKPFHRDEIIAAVQKVHQSQQKAYC